MPAVRAIPSRKRRNSGQEDLRQEWEAEERGQAQGVSVTTGEVSSMQGCCTLREFY